MPVSDSNTPTSTVKVPFHGEDILAIRDAAGEIWIPLRPLCDRLGLDPDNQAKRLRDPSRCPWSTTSIMTVDDAIGHAREMFCVDLNTLPMWLATVTSGKVTPRLRDTIVLYQKEAARSLRNYFTVGVAVNPRFSRDQILSAVDEQLLAIGNTMKLQQELPCPEGVKPHRWKSFSPQRRFATSLILAGFTPVQIAIAIGFSPTSIIRWSKSR